MRILEAFGEPISHGGEEALVVSLIEAMELSDLRVDFLTPYYCDNDRIKRLVAQRGGEVFELGVAFRPGHSRKEAKAPIEDFLKREKYDIVHIHSGSTSMLAIYSQIAAEAGVDKVIVHAHCAGVPNLKHSLAMMKNARAIRKYPSHYLACSMNAGEWMFPSDCLSNLQAVRNGIDASRFAFDNDARKEVREALGLKETDKAVGFVGRLCESKNPEMVIQSIKNLGEDYIALFAGDGELRSSIENLANESGVKAIFAGAVEDVERYYQAMDVLVLPSEFEGFSLVTLEAQASGLPVVVSTAVSEELNISGKVRFIPLSDRPAWNEAIRELTTGEERRSYKEEIRESGFDIREAAERIEGIYFE